MRPGGKRNGPGYLHEALLYSSAAELLAAAVPFLLDGVAAGEPVVVALGEKHAALVRAEVGNTGVEYLSGGEMYERPAGAIAAYRSLLAQRVAGGAGQIRIIGELAPAAFGVTWDWWARYESAINHAYDEFPLWSMCAYDSVATPAHVLADVVRTHPWTAAGDDVHMPSAGFVDPVSFLTGRRPVDDDPIQSGVPVVDVTDPTPAAVRHAIARVAPAALTSERLDGFVTSASEAVTNAVRYGRAPVRVRLWTGAERVVMTVHDRGAGPKDPYAGLLPHGDVGRPGGLGLWLTHQLCDHVVLDHADDGFTIRLTTACR